MWCLGARYLEGTYFLETTILLCWGFYPTSTYYNPGDVSKWEVNNLGETFPRVIPWWYSKMKLSPHYKLHSELGDSQAATFDDIGVYLFQDSCGLLYILYIIYYICDICIYNYIYIWDISKSFFFGIWGYEAVPFAGSTGLPRLKRVPRIPVSAFSARRHHSIGFSVANV